MTVPDHFAFSQFAASSYNICYYLIYLVTDPILVYKLDNTSNNCENLSESIVSPQRSDISFHGVTPRYVI
jgi:hypothetical protein